MRAAVPSGRLLMWASGGFAGGELEFAARMRDRDGGRAGGGLYVWLLSSCLVGLPTCMHVRSGRVRDRALMESCSDGVVVLVFGSCLPVLVSTRLMLKIAHWPASRPVSASTTPDLEVLFLSNGPSL